MLLRDSEIAKAIRTHLLNINQLSTNEQNIISFRMMEQMNNNVLGLTDILSTVKLNMENLANENKLLTQKVIDRVNKYLTKSIKV